MKKITSSVRSTDLLHTGKLKLYDNLKKVDVVDELHQRNISFHLSQPVNELSEILVKEMKGKSY